LSSTCGRDQHLRKDPARKLSREQCEAALEIFNNYKLSNENFELIRPVLLEVMQTAILGLSEDEHYFSHIGQRLDFPEVLKNKRGVFLRSCDADRY
jgi:hypothetical protein